MGSWGTEIFDNDDALDVRREFGDHLAKGATLEEATAWIRSDFGVDKAFALSRGADDNDVWLSLAAVHNERGHSSPPVAARALGIVESREELERWLEEDRPARAAALAEFGRALQDANPGVQPQRTPPFWSSLARLRRMPWWARVLVAALIALGLFLVLMAWGYSATNAAVWPVIAWVVYTGRTIWHQFLVWLGFRRKG
ncbi:hypothetical protein [Arthrobacter zhaoguopingii]|uniref:hypothetical protein n=1 Tax=Arthrobacter zhaoguopingii TaxID=2681491 RepID=UPI001359707D|nr:hypothetical protein [Arthrobacter zhaoguopingii]